LKCLENNFPNCHFVHHTSTWTTLRRKAWPMTQLVQQGAPVTLAAPAFMVRSGRMRTVGCATDLSSTSLDSLQQDNVAMLPNVVKCLHCWWGLIWRIPECNELKNIRAIADAAILMRVPITETPLKLNSFKG
jgi:hypothetical protein